MLKSGCRAGYPETPPAAAVWHMQGTNPPVHGPWRPIEPIEHHGQFGWPKRENEFVHAPSRAPCGRALRDDDGQERTMRASKMGKGLGIDTDSPESRTGAVDD